MIKQILILLLISQGILTFHPGIYECMENGDYYKLILNEDSTYQYLRQGPSFTSQIIRIGGKSKDSGNDNQITQFGIWKYKNDTLFLIDSITQAYNESGVVSRHIKGQNNVSVTVKDGQKNPYSDVMVSLNDRKPWKKTDSAGVVRFAYKEIKKYSFCQDDTITGRPVVDTIAVLSFGRDENTGRLKFDFHDLKKKKSNEDIPIVEIQIKKCDKLKKVKWLDTFENYNEYANDIVITQDNNSIVRKEIRIRKLPVVDNVIIFENPSFRHDGQTLKLENKK